MSCTGQAQISRLQVFPMLFDLPLRLEVIKAAIKHMDRRDSFRKDLSSQNLKMHYECG